MVTSSVADVPPTPGCPKLIGQIAIQGNFNLDKVGVLMFDKSILRSRIFPEPMYMYVDKPNMLTRCVLVTDI